MKVKSFALIEVLVSTVLIFVVFTLSTGVILKLREANPEKRYMNEIILRTYLIKSISNKLFFSSIENFENYSIERKVKILNNNKNLMIIEVEMSINEKRIKMREIVYEN